jgi:hypothetical protein
MAPQEFGNLECRLGLPPWGVNNEREPIKFLEFAPPTEQLSVERLVDVSQRMASPSLDHHPDGLADFSLKLEYGLRQAFGNVPLWTWIDRAGVPGHGPHCRIHGHDATGEIRVGTQGA